MVQESIILHQLHSDELLQVTLKQSDFTGHPQWDIFWRQKVLQRNLK